jgi:hypothetical protein
MEEHVRTQLSGGRTENKGRRVIRPATAPTVQAEATAPKAINWYGDPLPEGWDEQEPDFDAKEHSLSDDSLVIDFGFIAEPVDGGWIVWDPSSRPVCTQEFTGKYSPQGEPLWINSWTPQVFPSLAAARWVTHLIAAYAGHDNANDHHHSHEDGHDQ